MLIPVANDFHSFSSESHQSQPKATQLVSDESVFQLRPVHPPKVTPS